MKRLPSTATHNWLRTSHVAKSFTMKPKRIVFSATTIVLLCLIAFSSVSYLSNPPLGYTGAPSETNCTSCHTGTAITSGTEYNNLKLTTNMANDEYKPDSTYKITISYTESGRSRFGFMATTLKTSDNTRVGSYTVTSSSTTAKGTKSVASNTREYIYHKSGGTSGSGKISWTFDWTAPNSDQGDIKFYVVLNSTNNNNSESGDKIIVKNFKFSANSNLPVAKITMKSTTVCTDDTVYLDGTASRNSKTYKWTVNGATLNNRKDSVVKAVWSSPGTYTVALTTSDGSTSSKEEKISVKVLSSPINTVSITPRDTVCSGETIDVEALGGTKWTWSNGAHSQNISVDKTGTYWVKVQAGNGCVSKSKDLQLTVLDPPPLTIQLHGDATICSSDSVHIEASKGLVQYELYDKNMLVTSASKRLIAAKLLPGTYQITAEGKDAYGCKALTSNMINLTVEAQQQAPQAMCDNAGVDSVSISWIPEQKPSDYEVSIDSGKTWTQPNGSDGFSHVVNKLTYGTMVDFWVRAKAAAPCFYTATSKNQCKTKNCFEVPLTINEAAVCSNDSFAEVQLSGLSHMRYSVSFNKGPFTSDTSYQFNPSTFKSGDYALRINIIDSSALSCPAFDTIGNWIKVRPAPELTSLTNWLTKNGKNRICASDTKELLANTADNNGTFTSWEWKGPGVKNNNGSFEFVASLAQPGVHTLIYTASNSSGCAAQKVVKVAVDSIIKLSFTKAIDQRVVHLNAQIEGCNNWLWQFGNGDSSHQRNPSYYYNKDGTYHITLKSEDEANVCEQVIAKDSVSVVGGSVEALQNQVQVYPVPFSTELFITSDQAAGAVSVSISNASGVPVYNNAAYHFGNAVSLAALPKGVYLLSISHNNRVERRIIMK
ncbi:T9SS type A sorting domain-containing protein [bacterium]|nr:T9SS type A sorting domain-containing protein [bacterium]